MMAMWLLFTADPLSFWEILFWLIGVVLFAVLLPYILAVAAGLLLIPTLLLMGLFYSLYKICEGVGDLLSSYVECIFGGDDTTPAAAQPDQRLPASPEPIDEDLLRQWKEAIDQVSADHLHRVLREDE